MTYPVMTLDLAHAMQLAVMNQQCLLEQGIETDKNLVQLEIQMKSWLSDDFQAIGCLDSGLLIAFILFKQTGSGALLEKLFVHEDYREQGIAVQLVQHLASADTVIQVSDTCVQGVTIVQSTLSRLLSL